MKRPTSVALGHRRYPINWHAPLEPEKETGNLRFNPTVEVQIAARCPAEERAETLLHELHHLVWWHCGLPDRAREERVITAFEKGWAELIARNPDVMTWLVRELGRNLKRR